MKENLKYLLGFVAIALGIFLLWYFKAIVFFIFISAILSLVTRPLYDFFRGNRKGKKRQRKFSLSKSMSALATLLCLWAFLLGFASYVFPFLFEELQYLSKVDFDMMFVRLEEFANPILVPLEHTIFGDVSFSAFKNQITEFLMTTFDLIQLQALLASVADFVGSTFIALFSITFITFFLIKDEWLLLESIKLFVPETYYVGVDHMLWSINRLLRRYFIGIIIQITLISILLVLGLMLIGLEFRHALLIGLFSGFVNIIPYLGPLIGGLFGVLVSLVVYLQLSFPPAFLLYLGGILLLYVVVQLLDNLIFQPVIFSTSVKAHPLEIFLVVIMAGYMAGMVGMFLAIPVYTIVRVVAKEFFSKYNLVRKLTGKL